MTVKGFLGKPVCGADPPFSLQTWPHTRHRFCFPEVKTAFRGSKFADIKDIRKNIALTINYFPLDTFNDCFVEDVERHYKCVTFEGAHVSLVDRVPELYCSVSYNLNWKAQI
jgi:hypothetical protein